MWTCKCRQVLNHISIFAHIRIISLRAIKTVILPVILSGCSLTTCPWQSCLKLGAVGFLVWGMAPPGCLHDHTFLRLGISHLSNSVCWHNVTVWMTITPMPKTKIIFTQKKIFSYREVFLVAWLVTSGVMFHPPHESNIP